MTRSPGSSRPEPDINLNPTCPSYRCMPVTRISVVRVRLDGWRCGPARMCRHAQALQFGNARSPVLCMGAVSDSEQGSFESSILCARIALCALCIRRSV